MRAGLLLSGILLVGLRLWAGPSPALDPYTSEFEKSPPNANAVTREWAAQQTKEAQDRFILRVAIPQAVKAMEPPGTTVRATPISDSSPYDASLFSGTSSSNLGFILLLVLAGGLAFRKLAPLFAEFLNRRFNPWLPLTVPAGVPSNLMVEDQSFADFLAAFRVGPSAKACAKGNGANDNQSAVPLKQFFATAPKMIVALRTILQQVRPALDNGARKSKIEELRLEIRGFKGMAGLPELLPAWQMAAAIEGLLTQLTRKAQDVTLSTLRTIAQAVDLLEALSVPGIKPDIASEPPIRLLAVDDDPISRHAISFALKKALNQPDLAMNADAALPLTSEKLYDAIFLDVQMPGMDGFELCTKIHEAGLNKKTPIIFVTCQSDFEARAKSTLAGGHDLMAKPFLTFEITLKALTLVLRGRLESCVAMATIMKSEARKGAKTPAAQPSPVIESKTGQTGPATKENRRTRRARKFAAAKESSRQKTVAAEPKSSTPKATEPASKEPAESVPPTQPVAAAKGMVRLPIETLTEYLQRELEILISPGADLEEREEILGELCLGIDSLTTQADRKDLSPAFRLSSALQGLLKKLFDDPNRATPCTLQTAGAALSLLDELHRTKPAFNLTEPPVRILIVDDDPLARRAITGSVQLSFAKPDNVASGEAAVAAAMEKAFDVIFLDVRMPGMDGYTACSKIHETPLNATTPVIFVTGHSDTGTQAPLARAGGSGLIPKPALSVEVTLTALTVAIRSRLLVRKAPAKEPPESKPDKPASRAAAKSSSADKAETKEPSSGGVEIIKEAKSANAESKVETVGC